jgi:hypothetical protein
MLECGKERTPLVCGEIRLRAEQDYVRNHRQPLILFVTSTTASIVRALWTSRRAA